MTKIYTEKWAGYTNYDLLDLKQGEEEEPENEFLEESSLGIGQPILETGPSMNRTVHSGGELQFSDDPEEWGQIKSAIANMISSRGYNNEILATEPGVAIYVKLRDRVNGNEMDDLAAEIRHSLGLSVAWEQGGDGFPGMVIKEAAVNAGPGDRVLYRQQFGQQAIGTIVSEYEDPQYWMIENEYGDQFPVKKTDVIAPVTAQLRDPSEWEQFKTKLMEFYTKRSPMSEIERYFQTAGVSEQELQQMMMELLLEGKIEGTPGAFQPSESVDYYMQQLEGARKIRQQRYAYLMKRAQAYRPEFDEFMPLLDQWKSYRRLSFADMIPALQEEKGLDSTTAREVVEFYADLFHGVSPDDPTWTSGYVSYVDPFLQGSEDPSWLHPEPEPEAPSMTTPSAPPSGDSRVERAKDWIRNNYRTRRWVKDTSIIERGSLETGLTRDLVFDAIEELVQAGEFEMDDPSAITPRVRRKASKEVDAKQNDVENKIIEFFRANPNPADKEVHALAEQLQINPHEFESMIYKLLGQQLKTAGGGQKTAQMDPATQQHLEAWLENEYSELDRDEVRDKMLETWKDDPAYWEDKGWSSLRDAVMGAKQAQTWLADPTAAGKIAGGTALITIINTLRTMDDVFRKMVSDMTMLGEQEGSAAEDAARKKDDLTQALQNLADNLGIYAKRAAYPQWNDPPVYDVNIGDTVVYLAGSGEMKEGTIVREESDAWIMDNGEMVNKHRVRSTNIASKTAQLDPGTEVVLDDGRRGKVADYDWDPKTQLPRYIIDLESGERIYNIDDRMVRRARKTASDEPWTSPLYSAGDELEFWNPFGGNLLKGTVVEFDWAERDYVIEEKGTGTIWRLGPMHVKGEVEKFSKKVAQFMSPGQQFGWGNDTYEVRRKDEASGLWEAVNKMTGEIMYVDDQAVPQPDPWSPVSPVRGVEPDLDERDFEDWVDVDEGPSFSDEFPGPGEVSFSDAEKQELMDAGESWVRDQDPAEFNQFSDTTSIAFDMAQGMGYTWGSPEWEAAAEYIGEGIQRALGASG